MRPKPRLIIEFRSETRVPIISIASPSQVARESEGAAHCLADHHVASGHIIQPEHNLGDDRTVSVRGKFKEHLITSDALTAPRQPSPKPHVLADDRKITSRAGFESLPKQLDGADGQVWDEVTTEFHHHQRETTAIDPCAILFPSRSNYRSTGPG